MKHAAKIAAAALCVAAVAIVPAFAGCSTQTYVTSIAKSSSDENGDTYTIYYSDGSTDTLTVTNGKDGENAAITASELYAEYLEQTGEDITYSEFLDMYLSISTDSTDSTASMINYCLQSSLKIYSEFVETTYSMSMFGGVSSVSDINVYTGAAVIYSIDDNPEGYTYIVTNYHVVYDNSADSSRNGGSKIAREIYGYLYGSEGTPTASGKDSSGYTEYDYGDYGIALEYVGGSVETDLAVLRVKTEDIKSVNENIKAVDLAEGYYVGETAIAIGNPEGNGLSVTQGIISTENESITLNIDGTLRSYRSLRIDTPLYSGNSGGGLFNAKGQLIGITNAGNTSDQNINYAVPLEIVTGTVDNIIYYVLDGDDSTNGAYTVDFGVTLTSSNSKYVYDSSIGYGKITETVSVSAVASSSIAESLGIASGDVIVAITVNGEEQEVTRTFTLDDIALTLRVDDRISFTLERSGEEVVTSTYVLTSSNFSALS